MLPKHGSYRKSVETTAVLWQPVFGYKHTGMEKE